MTLPKVLAMSRISRIGAPSAVRVMAVLPFRMPSWPSLRSVRSVMAVSPPGLFGVAADELVGEHGQQQHHAEEELEPVGVPARVDDALGGHPEDECADRGADRRTEAAGEQAATDDRGDDVDELLA